MGASARGEALAGVTAALAEAPDDPALLFARGEILFAWGRYREALDGYLRAEAQGLVSAALNLQLGWSYLHNGHVMEAEARMRQAILADADAKMAHFGLGITLRAQQRRDAAASFERVLELDANDFDALLELGSCKVDQNDPMAGEALFRRAIAVDGKRAVGWQNLGVALQRQDRPDEALEAFVRAEKLDAQNDGDLDSFVNLALQLENQGRVGEALELFERLLPRRPDVNGHHGYALALLRAERMAEGWDHFEFRWMNEPLLSMRFRSAQPPWSGQDLRGKTIRLRIEQGFGDVFQFVRYAPLLKALGATVQLPKFADVASGFTGVDCVVDTSEPPREFDYHINLLSLPRVFGTEASSIPASVPYLTAATEKVAQWAPRLAAEADVLKVGLVWSGNPARTSDRNRSMTLRALAPLAGIPGVRWFSLQKVVREDEQRTPPDGFDWVDLGPDLAEWSDTAAVISLLDLVICVDTAVAHLAGALGKPVWVMLPTPAEWRWMDRRDDSPWYPTMRLFRQKHRGDWGAVVDSVKGALHARVQDKSGNAATTSGPPSASAPITPATQRPRANSGHRTGLSAVTETRYGILQYFPDEPFLGDSIGWYGEYLQPQLSLLARMLQPGATVLEVGPGVGAHALFIAAVVGPKGHLILYEPRREWRQVLRQNLAANGLGNVTLMRGDLQPGEAVESETVDELQLEHLDCLKINEGATALAVLEGAMETLWRLRPMLFIAAPDEARVGELAMGARAYGYRCWQMATGLFEPGNFNRREDDIFAGRQALALLALPEEIEVDVAIAGCVEIS